MDSKPADPMTKNQFIELLEDILKEKKEENGLKLMPPYNVVYDKCVLGYDISYVKKQYEENITFKTSISDKETIEAHEHLKYVLESLIKSYGITAIINTLKKI